MKFSKGFIFLFFAVCLTSFVGCDDSDGGGDDGRERETTKVPDPVGTITANIAENVGFLVYDDAHIQWCKPDNFHLLSVWQNPMGGHWWQLLSVYDAGKVNGLGNITQIPLSGFSFPIGDNKGVACETGHGYIIKMQHFNNGDVVYIRLYVVEKIISTSGGVMGAKVKYQYPFEP